MNQLGFELSRYPTSPGWKAEETSKEAAARMESRAETLRDKAMEALRDAELTADEIAIGLGESILAIRPRISELKRLGRIENTGLRRTNSSGHSAIVWRIK